MRTKGNSIIGGMFGLELGVPEVISGLEQKPAFFAGPHLLLATARSVFTLLGRSLRPGTVWLPSYLCGVVLGAFPAPLMRVRFYPVDERLEIADEAWLAEVQAGEMVVFIDYFGFNQWSACGAEVRERGGWVVEDASQALLNARFCEYAHYVVFSPRKFVGVPDGGILLAQRDAKLPEVSFPSPPSQWWLDAARASILRAEFDRHGGERTWFQFFQKTDLLGPLEPCRMSDLAFLILKNCINWQVVAQARRRNYQFLASELEDIAILPHLSDGVAPLGFSVRLKDRDRVRGGLFAAQIYPPVHWPIAGVVPPEFDASHRLAAEIMTIPCDQRYDIPDMKRVVNELRRSIAC